MPPERATIGAKRDAERTPMTSERSVLPLPRTSNANWPLARTSIAARGVVNGIAEMDKATATRANARPRNMTANPSAQEVRGYRLRWLRSLTAILSGCLAIRRARAVKTSKAPGVDGLTISPSHAGIPIRLQLPCSAGMTIGFNRGRGLVWGTCSKTHSVSPNLENRSMTWIISLPDF